MEVIFFLIGVIKCFDFFHKINREYVWMFFHPIGVSRGIYFELKSL